MRVVRNDAFIKARTQFTQRGSMIGMGLLVVSLVLASRSPLISWLFLISGFAVAMIAVRVGNRYVRPPRQDLVLDKLLKGLDNKYALYHYFQPADHLLLTPSGMIAIHMQEQRGEISVRGGRWRQRPFWQRLRVFLGEAGLGNPFREVRRQLAGTGEEMTAAMGQDGAAPLEGIVVFYSGKARLEVEKPEFPVVLPEDIKATIRAMAEAHAPLPARSRKALAAALRGEGPAAEEES